MTQECGMFYGIGVGPGDPELLTRKAERVLRMVDVVCYPACKLGASSYAFGIVKELIDRDRQTVHGLVFPMEKDFARLVPIWRESAHVIVADLLAGKHVAFITEGDPMLYSTFLHVYDIIAAEHPFIPVEVIPGVSSINAGAAAGLTPLAQGDEKIVIIPATYHLSEIRTVLEQYDTIVLMKVGSVFDHVFALLEELRLLDQALLFSRVGDRKGFVTRDLAAYQGKRLGYLTTLLVKKDTPRAWSGEDEVE
jgi:precorrin-2/cobalt-factor-2 C20-methyltransferase